MPLRIWHCHGFRWRDGTWVEADGATLLVDCGLSGRMLAQRLAARGLEARRIAAVAVPHEANEAVAYRIAGGGATAHILTDLGDADDLPDRPPLVLGLARQHEPGEVLSIGWRVRDHAARRSALPGGAPRAEIDRPLSREKERT